MRDAPLIEPLEDRIAPATVTFGLGGRSASFTDTHGDLVTITTTKGNFSTVGFVFDPNASGQLTQLTLTGHADFTGAAITFTAAPPANQTATQFSLGYLNAIGLNLASISLPGDLARIDVGGGASAVAIGKLSVNSLGLQGSATQGGITNPTTISNIAGTASLVQIAGDLDGTLQAGDYKSKPGTGNIAVLNIGGSLNGSGSNGVTNLLGMGEVAFTGKLGKTTIMGGIKGGASEFSGSLNGAYGTLASIGSVAVLGSVPSDPDPSPLPGVVGTSILGGTGSYTGAISAVVIGSVSVAGDVRGNTGGASGFIQGGTSLGTVQIGGSLIGANLGSTSTIPNSQALYSGSIFGGTIKTVSIAKNIYGGSGLDSGQIFSTGLIQKATVSGDIIGGSAGQTGNSGTYSGYAGSIFAHAMGTITVGGSLIGGTLVANDSTQLASSSGVIVSETSITKLTVGKNITGGSGQNSGTVLTKAGNLTSLVVGGADSADGSIQGGSGQFSGEIGVTGSLGSAQIALDVAGGSGADSGQIVVSGPAGTISIGRNLSGGSAAFAGNVTVQGTLKSLSIGNDLQGGSADHTGLIAVNGAAGTLSIGESVIGGTGNFSADISFIGSLKTLSVAKNFTGGNNPGSGTLENSGYFQADSLGTAKIGGILSSGAPGSGMEDSCGAIRASHTIGSISVGSIAGTAANPAIISAVGVANLASKAKTDVAIGSISIAGNSVYADILAGYSPDTNHGSLLGTGVNADAQIGTVTIGGNLQGTNILAGVSTANPGTGGSVLLSGAGVTNLAGIVSKISSIVIKGTVLPTASGSDAFGIAAQYVAAAKVGSSAIPLLAGADNDTFAATHDQPLPAAGGDVFVYEV